MDELIRRALLGSWEARQECTKKRIALPCPYCDSDKLYVDGPYRSNDIPAEIINDVDRDYDGFSVSCSCGNYIEVEYGTFKDTLAKWNTRPAPPVGRCRDCRLYTALGHCKVHSQEPDQHGSGAYVEMLPDDFCSYFEPKED